GRTRAGDCRFARTRHRIRAACAPRPVRLTPSSRRRSVHRRGRRPLMRSAGMIPGETFARPGDIVLNEGRPPISLTVANTGDRPIQVGSHFHFAEANAALAFDRQAALGRRLDIPAGTAVRFEPGQSRAVSLIPYGGARVVYGFNQAVMGPLPLTSS